MRSPGERKTHAQVRAKQDVPETDQNRGRSTIRAPGDLPAPPGADHSSTDRAPEDCGGSDTRPPRYTASPCTGGTRETVRIWGRSSSRAPGDPSMPPGVDGVQSWQAPLIEANPMDKLDRRVRLPSLAPHGLGPGQVEAILRGRLRDRVLFRLIAETGLRAAEALSVHVEDLDLAPGDDYLRVLGKGGRPRTALLSDVGFLAGTTGRPSSGTPPRDAEGHAAWCERITGRSAG
jgi:hypothetical protein